MTWGGGVLELERGAIIFCSIYVEGSFFVGVSDANTSISACRIVVQK